MVTDPAGAPVPNVTVTLTSQSTSQTLSATTGAGGRYGFSLLSPGNYRVTFSAQGFKTAQMASMAVNVSEAPVVDATLETGSSEERVECQCRVSQATSSTGTLVESKTITAVPLTTRNFTQVLSMSSGSAADVNNAGSLGRGTQSPNVNGNTTAGTYTIDGAPASNAVPNPDAISEFKIQTSQYDSGYGAHVPQTNLITRSGGSDFHGDVWEFVRNDIFNANDFFLNSAGQHRPNLKQNQFGVTLGGPVKRQKLFIFGSYQGTRQVNGLDPQSLSTLLLPPLTNDRSAATIAAEFCPANHPGDKRYLTFAGGKQLDCGNVDTSSTAKINPVALTLLQTKLPDGTYLIPTPQTILTSGHSAGLGLFSKSIPSRFSEDQYIINPDLTISAKHTLAARVFLSRVHQYRSYSAPYFLNPGPQAVPGTPHHWNPADELASVKLTSILTSDIVNQVSMWVSHNYTYADSVGVPSAASVGITPLDPAFSQPPEIDIFGGLGTFRFLGNIEDDSATGAMIYQWADNLSWIHGKHTTRAGVFLDTQLNTYNNTGSAKGKITIQNFEDFLVGLSATDNQSPLDRSNIQTILGSAGNGPRGEFRYQYRNYYGSAFVEDDIKLNSRLTVDLGLRWERLGPAFDTAGTAGSVWPSLLGQLPIPPASGTFIGDTVPPNYNPNLANPYTGQPFGALPPGVLVRSTKSFYQNNAPLDTFAPRFGFAWQPGGKQGRLSVRGGYGWFYQTPPFSGNAGVSPLIAAPPFAQGFCRTDASNDASTLADPFPAATLGFVPRTPTSKLCDRVAGPSYRIPKLQQWNLSTQYSLSSTLSLDIGYVGTYGSHLLLLRGLNQPLLAGPSNPVNCGLPNSAAGLGVSPALFANLGIDSAGCVRTSTSANAYLRVPFVGEAPTALSDNAFIGWSWYHSLQATLRKQISHGLTFQAAYTLSKAENNTNVYNDQNNLSLDWARATFDRTHRWIANFSYEIPDVHAQGFAGRALTGWSITGIVVLQSGLPLTLTDVRGGGVYGNNGVSTITLCPGATKASLATSGRDQSRLNSWFNAGPSVICPPPAIGTDGVSTGYGNSGQGIVTGPGQFNTDFSLGKTTKVGGIREGAELAFRVEFYNTFNHPQFGNPGTTFGTATFGVITQASVAPRLIQFGLKYIF